MGARLKRDVTRLAVVLADLISNLERLGLTHSLSDDFPAYQDEWRELLRSDGEDLSEEPSRLFNNGWVDLDEGEFRYLTVRDGDRPVAIQAIRLDVVAKSAARLLDQVYRRLFCSGSQQVLEHAQIVYEMKGKLVYHGSIHTIKDYRGKRIASIGTRIIHLVAMLDWDPDYIYGFVEQKLVSKGYHYQIGYNRADPFGTIYSSPPATIEGDDWIVWMDRVASLQSMDALYRLRSKQSSDP